MLDNPRILTILVTMETNKSTRKIWEKIPQIFGWQIVMGCNHEMPTQLKAREVTLRFFQDLLVFASPFATCATISLWQHSHLISHSVGLNEQKVIPKTNMTSSVALPQSGNVPCKRFARNWPGRASVEQMPQQPRKTRYVEVWQIYPIYPPKIMMISRPGKWRQMFLSKFWLAPIPCWIQGWKVVSPAKVDFRFWPRTIPNAKNPGCFSAWHFSRPPDIAAYHGIMLFPTPLRMVLLVTSRRLGHHFLFVASLQPPRFTLGTPTGSENQGTEIDMSWYIGTFHIQI